MSFSLKVKKELTERYGGGRHCAIAEIAAIINICGRVTAKSICVQTENVLVARKYFTLVKKAFRINNEIRICRNKQLHKSRTYILVIDNPSDVNNVLMATGIKSEEIKLGKIDTLVTGSSCCKRAYIRGAFLSAGSLNDPAKNYHLEFVNNASGHAEALVELVNEFGLSAKMVMRKDNYVIYLKEGEQIVDLLNIIEAHLSLMDFENIRIIKDMRNNVNRIVNCETANLNKTVSASVKQIMDITYIDEMMGLECLPRQLEDIARLRLSHPDTSLKELGEMLSPPVGKSGVNHRLRKINEMAQNLREENRNGENFNC